MGKRRRGKRIKQVLTFGALEEYINRDPLQGYRVPGVNYPDPVFLTVDELTQLIDYRFEPHETKLSEVRYIFLIYAFTGMAYADLEGFMSKHLSTMQSGNDLILWLEKPRKKTGIKPRQPISPGRSTDSN